MLQMKSTYRMLVVVLVSCFAEFAIAQNWPQAARPHGDWSTRAETEVPAAFNVASGESVLWNRPMEESGQSGIVVWNDRLFLSILKPYQSEQNQELTTSTIRALCLNAESGATIWEYDIEGEGQTGYMGGFSDLTSPSPITDGEYVWFTNAGGKLVCLDWQGKLVSERSWRSENEILKPVKAFPFNKQFEPLLSGIL
jgi:outer membrane protein assembly factor BamB